jgi:hypothetical protein
MAVTSQNTLVAAVGTSQKLEISKATIASTAGRVTSLWTATGTPTVGTVTAGAVTQTSATVGALPFANGNGSTTAYVTGFRGANTGSTGLLILFDVLWAWTSGTGSWSATTAGAQTTGVGTFTVSGLTPARGTAVGTEAWLEVTSALGANTPTVTLSYTNSALAAGRTAQMSALPASSAAGSMFQFALAAGDVGVQSVQNINLSVSTGGGTARVLIVRRVAEIPIMSTTTPVVMDAFDLGLPSVYDNACLLMAMVPSGTAAGPVIGTLSLGQG